MLAQGFLLTWWQGDRGTAGGSSIGDPETVDAAAQARPSPLVVPDLGARVWPLLSAPRRYWWCLPTLSTAAMTHRYLTITAKPSASV